MHKIIGFNPLTPERIAERRAAVLDVISAALFRPEGSRREGGRHEGRQERSRPDRNATQGARHERS